MGQLFVILMRILFPRDPIARCRELMRSWLGMVIDSITDPEEIESLAYWSEDRAMREATVGFLEYFMRVLIHGRARQMLGLPHIHIPLQRHHIRHPNGIAQLLKRITQLARDFHNLDRLAARQAERMKREVTRDPLRLAATPQSTSPALRAVEADHLHPFNVQIASPSATHWGRWIARSCAQDGEGAASSRGPPSLLDCLPPTAQLAGSTCEAAPSRPQHPEIFVTYRPRRCAPSETGIRPDA